MITVPARILSNYGVVHEPKTRVTFYHPDGTTSATLNITDGTFTNDTGVWPNQTADITVQTGNVTPAALPAALTPYGGWAKIELGNVAPSALSGTGGTATTDWWTLATLKVIGIETEYPAGTIRVQLCDVSAQINERAFELPYKSTTSQLTSAFVTTIVASTATVINNLGANDRTIPTGHEADGERWTAVVDALQTASAQARVDELGRIVLEPLPTLKGTADQAFTFGSRGTLTGYRTALRWGPNRTAIRFTDPAWRPQSTYGTQGTQGQQDAPITLGTWEDTTTGSPTHVTGYYGRHTLVRQRQQKVTQVEADAAAAAMGRRVRGRVGLTTIECVPAPWVQPGDTVQVDLLDKTRHRHLVQSVTFPLSLTGAMTIVTRETVPNLTTPL